MLKQIGKVICYLLLFVGMQNVASIFIAFGYGVIYFVEKQLAGEMVNRLQVAVASYDFMKNNIAWSIAVGNIVCVLFLWVFFSLRKKKWYREANIHPIALNKIFYLILLGLVLAIMVNCGLSCLPASVLEDYKEASGALMTNVTMWSLIGEILIIPFVEEIIFRGLILSRLRRAMPVWLAVMLSSLCFGAIHNGQWLWMLYAGVLGAIFAAIDIKMDSILPSIVLHVVFNLAGVILAMLLPQLGRMTYALIAAGGAGIFAVLFARTVKQ